MSDDLIIELKRIAQAMEASATAMKVSKAPSLWSIEDIAAWIKMDYVVVRDRIIKAPTFPKAFAPTQAKNGHKLWFEADVVEWARINLGRYKHLQISEHV